MVSFNCMRETQKQFADPVGNFILFHVYGRRSPRSLPIEIHLKIIINCFARNKDTLLFRDHHNWHWSLDTPWGSWKPISPIRHGVHQWGKRRYAAVPKEGTKQTNTTRWYTTDITVPPLSLIIVKQGSCHDALHRQQGGLDCCWPSMLSINTSPFHSIHPDQARRCIIPAVKHFVALFWFGQDRTIGDRDDDHGGFVCCLFFLR